MPSSEIEIDDLRPAGVTRTIRLIGESQEGGYTFVHSPDLPGFTFVLSPGEDQDIKTVMDAMFIPLTAFLQADRGAKHVAGPEPVQVTGIRRAR